MRATTLALVLTTLATTPMALAKPAAPAVTQPAESTPATEEASHRFQRGVALYKERSYDAALAEFNRAYELAPDYRVLFNIAQVQAERGDYVAAAKCFRQYLHEGGSAIAEPRLADVKAEIARLEGRIAEVHVMANVQGAELLIDGEPVGFLPSAAIAVNAGVRRLTVRKKGYETAERRLMLTGGEETTLQLTLKSELATQPTLGIGAGLNSDGSPRPHSGESNPGLWISLGVMGVAGAATAVFGALAYKADNQLDDELNRYPASPEPIDERRRELKRFAVLTDSCGAVTLLGLGATIYFAATGKKPTEAKNQAAVQAAPVNFGAHGAGWQVTGQF